MNHSKICCSVMLPLLVSGLLFAVAGCRDPVPAATPPNIPEPTDSRTSTSTESTEELDVTLTDADRDTLRQLGVAVFRNKIILDAQPPITDEQLAGVYEKVDGEIPPDLVALWKTTFGGSLDYDYEVVFDDYLHEASPRELFYPGSDHYHDLHGWIDHDLEIGQTIAEERGETIPNRTPYLPFGGFEYLERIYVSVEPEEYGQVLLYAQGIPWEGRLNEDSIATVASSVAELFDQLALDEDPFSDDAGEYANGKEMVERIRAIESDHPALAKKLEAILRRSVIDWRSIVAETDFSHPLSPRQAKALRLALLHAAEHGDIEVINTLHDKSAPFDVTVRGTGTVLVAAMEQKSFPVVQRLLELQVDLGEAPIIWASECPDALLLKLIDAEVTFSEEALYAAAETGALQGALALAKSPHLAAPLAPKQLAANARERAQQNENDAVQIELGQLNSYLTPKQYRERAAALEEFASQLEAGSNP